MATLAQIQRGSITLANTTASVTVDRGVDPGFDTTVDTTKTLLLFTQRMAVAGAQSALGVAGVLTDGNTITFTRAGTANDVTIYWTLITWSAGVVVQQASITLGEAVTTNTAAISDASLGGGRFLVAAGATCSTADNPQRHLANVKFDSTTQISATRITGTGTVVYKVQVVEYVGCTVQEVAHSLIGTTLTTSDKTISTVTVANTLVFGAGNASGGVLSEAYWTMLLADPTTLRFVRTTGTAFDFAFTAYVVEFSDGTVVRQNAVAHASGTGTVNTTITEIVLARSVPLMSGATPWGGATGRSATATNSTDRHFVTSELTSVTNHQSVRGVTTNDQNYDSQVVQFALGGAVPVVQEEWFLPFAAQ